MNFQAQSKQSGDEFEMIVERDLLSKDYTIISTNTKIEGIGVNVDYIAEDSDSAVEYGEAKGGRSGGNKRPGAERTDNVKKAICNGALLKFKNPECKYVVYFSAPPKAGSSSEEMINTALEAGYVDEVRYLEYDEQKKDTYVDHVVGDTQYPPAFKRESMLSE